MPATSPVQSAILTGPGPGRFGSGMPSAIRSGEPTARSGRTGGDMLAVNQLERPAAAPARPKFVFPGNPAQSLRFAFWRRVMRLGERLGSDFLMYNPGMFEFFHAAAVHDAPILIDALLAEFPGTNTVADIGCGSGAMLAEFKRRGCHVQGCEYSARGRKYAVRQGVPAEKFFLTPDGAAPLTGAPFDLAISCEVAEHIPSFLADAFVKYLTHASSNIMLTAAHPGQGGTGHVNEQPKSYWIDKFAKLGYAHREDAAERVASTLRQGNANPWLCDNVMVFGRP